MLLKHYNRLSKPFHTTTACSNSLRQNSTYIDNSQLQFAKKICHFLQSQANGLVNNTQKAVSSLVSVW